MSKSMPRAEVFQRINEVLADKVMRKVWKEMDLRNSEGRRREMEPEKEKKWIGSLDPQAIPPDISFGEPDATAGAK